MYEFLCPTLYCSYFYAPYCRNRKPGNQYQLPIIRYLSTMPFSPPFQSESPVTISLLRLRTFCPRNTTLKVQREDRVTITRETLVLKKAMKTMKGPLTKKIWLLLMKIKLTIIKKISQMNYFMQLTWSRNQSHL